MIPIEQIVPENLYSQDDATFLLGTGFTEDAAREAITEACRSGQLASRSWRRRYWFTGREFMAWIARWFGTEVTVDTEADEDAPLRASFLSGKMSPRNRSPSPYGREVDR